MNRTIVERAKCLLFDANLDKTYWAEAANMAVYLINRSVCAPLVNKTPEEVYSGNKVDLSQLQLFGSEVMVHIPKQRRKKWDRKSFKNIFVGYDSECKGYRCIDPDSKKLTISRDVIFLEKVIDTCENDSNDFVSVRDVESESEEQDFDPSSDISDGESERSEGDQSIIVLDDTVTTSPESTTNQTGNSSKESSNEEDVSFDDSVKDPDYEPNFSDIHEASMCMRRQQLNNYVSYSATANTIGSEPETVRDAVSCQNANEWKSAMEEEINSLDENNTWALVDLPVGRKAVKTKWVFKTKRDECGAIVRHKARLVAKGCSQRYGIDYTETYSPVVRHTSLRFLVALAVKNNLKIDQMDAVTAFMQGELNEEIYIEQPEGFNDGTNRVCKLNKAINGLKQSGRLGCFNQNWIRVCYTTNHWI